MHPAIAQYRTGIAAICRRYGIRRLEVFGSAARASDFDPAHSDADFLVEFAPGVEPGLHSIFGAKADLEALLGRGGGFGGAGRGAQPLCAGQYQPATRDHLFRRRLAIFLVAASAIPIGARCQFGS